MRKLTKVLAALAAVTMVFGCAVTTSYAEEKTAVASAEQTVQKENVQRHAVTGVSEDSVMLSNGCELTNNDFAKYSGTDKLLKCGDVIETNVLSISDTIPGDFDFAKDSYVKYIGTVNDVYKDTIEDLTVAEKNNGIIKLTDKDGNEYNWVAYYTTKVYVGKGIEKPLTFKSETDIDAINVGDVIKCAYEKVKRYENDTAVTANSVVYPISIESKADIPFIAPLNYLKGDADLNGVVDLADLTAIAKYNLSSSSYPLENDTALANADMNGDGKVDGLDVSRLIEQQLGKGYVSPAQADKTSELTAGIEKLSVQSAKPSEKFEDSQIDFAVSFLKNTLEEDKNTLVSPYSAAQALGMTANGAKGNTLREMMDVIGGGMDIDSFNDSMAALKNGQPNDENCKMLTANSIWYRNDGTFEANRNFLQTNKSYYDAQIYAAPMNDDTVKDINSWVSEHTDKMIPHMIDKLENDPVMALVNAVTFDAKWASPFDKAFEKEGFFTSADGSKQDAEVMYEEGFIPFLEDGEATGFIKSYEGGRYAFAAILPNEGTSVSDYVNGLTADKFKDLIKSAHNTKINVRMPKFTIDYGKKLNEALQAMGINEAFKGTADLSKMGRSQLGDLYIDMVLQKTHIEVDKGGTKAAAATVVLPAPVCAPMNDVTLNRPFVYAIVDTETNIPVFMGTLNTLK